MQHRRPKNRVFAPFLLAVFLTGCTSKHVVVQGNFPPPVIEKVPVVMGVLYPTEFAKHEIFDPAQLSGESDWRVSTGAAQIEFWDQFTFLHSFSTHCLQIALKMNVKRSK